MSFGGMSGSTTYGLVENAITHPANGLFISPGYTYGTNLVATSLPVSGANLNGANSS